MAHERLGICVDCSEAIDATGKRGRVPARCPRCTMKLKIARNTERYRRNPPAPRPRTPSSPRFRTIICVECSRSFEIQIKPGGLPKSCPECKHDRRLRLTRETVQPPEVRLARRLRRYGLSAEQWQDMFEAQRGRCAICEQPPSGVEGRSALLEVDHCHETGEVRALLCQTCNTALGKFRDSPHLLRRAADYVEMHHDLSTISDHEGAF